MMEINKYFLMAQTTKAQQAAAGAKDGVIRATEAKPAKSPARSFDHELSKANQTEVSEAAPQKVDDALKEAAGEIAKEMPVNAEKQDTGKTEAVSPEKAPVEAKATEENSADLKDAADTSAMLLAMVGSTLIPQQPLAELQAVQVPVEEPDALLDNPAKQLVTEIVNPSLEALLPQDEDAAKQAAQNQQLMNLLQNSATDSGLVEAALPKQAQQQPNVQQPVVNEQAQQPVIQQDVISAKPLETTAAAVMTAVQPQQSLRAVRQPESEPKEDSKSNILEGIPLTVEDKTTVIDNVQAQMSGDMQKQPKQGGQPQALTNAEAGGKTEQGVQLSEEAVFDKAETVKTDNAQMAVSADSFAQTFNEVQQADNVQQPQPVQADFDIPKQIIEQAKLIRSAQNTEMVIKLKPEHLGELTLRVSVTAGGAVNASFHSDNAQVRGIIESTMVTLKQELQNQGLKVDNIDVQTGLADNSFLGSQANQQQGYQQQPQQSATVRNLRADLDAFAEDAELTAAAAAEDTQRVQTVTAEGVDYKV